MASSLERLLEGYRAGDPHLFIARHGFWGRHYHTGILWALETIAWFPQHLVRVAMMLARLSELDDGITIHNRPINSLISIFLWWHPATAAAAHERILALRQLAARYPQVTWKILERTLPGSSGRTTSTNPQPKWATFRDPPVGDRTQRALYLYAVDMLQIAASLCEHIAERWMTVLRSCSQIEPEKRPPYYKLAVSAAGSMDPEQCEILYSELRDFIGNQRQHSTAKWAMSEDLLRPLDDLLADIAPKDPISRALWLFSEWHPSVGVASTNVTEMQGAVASARQNSLREIIATSGLPGVHALAIRAKYPAFVALTATQVLSPGELWTLLDGIVQAPSPFAMQLSQDLHRQDESRWKQDVTKIAGAISPIQTAIMLGGAPCGPFTWNFAEALGAAVSEAYWKQVLHFPDGDSVYWNELARRLLIADRADTVVDLAALYKPTIDAEILIQTAMALIRLASVRPIVCDGHDIQDFMAAVRSSTIERLEIAKLEYALLPLMHIDEDESHPLLLHQMLSEDPKTFVSIMEDMYVPESISDDDKDALRNSQDEMSRARGKIGHKLLQLMHTIPGSRQDGTIDEDILFTWIVAAQEASKSCDRVAVTDAHIGRLLAHAPANPETGTWPHRSIELILERLTSISIERGIVIERFNMRGVVSRGPDSGGDLERELASQYRSYAQAALPSSARTRALLERIAASWELDAQSEDKEMLEENLDY